jgi:hypothetical protein
MLNFSPQVKTIINNIWGNKKIQMFIWRLVTTNIASALRVKSKTMSTVFFSLWFFLSGVVYFSSGYKNRPTAWGYHVFSFGAKHGIRPTVGKHRQPHPHPIHMWSARLPSSLETCPVWSGPVRTRISPRC